jgi:hypothetical protein
MKNILAENNNRAKQARQRGIEYSLMPLTLDKLYKEERCFYLNVPLNVKNKMHKDLTKLSLDRINCDGGYTKDNVVACSWIANQLKNLIECGLITPIDVIECGKRFKLAMREY